MVLVRTFDFPKPVEVSTIAGALFIVEMHFRQSDSRGKLPSEESIQRHSRILLQ